MLAKERVVVGETLKPLAFARCETTDGIALYQQRLRTAAKIAAVCAKRAYAFSIVCDA